MTDLPALLRAETITTHERLEALPFFKALYAGTLPKLSIVSFLRCLAIVHAVLEREIFQNSDPDVAKLGQHVRPKVPLLMTDLKALDAETLPSITPAIQSGIEFGAEILTNANSPLSLVGTLYVLEGSQNGGVLLKQAYARCLNMREEQPSYFGCYGSTTATHWKEFSDLLTSLVLSDEG
jgi:heme oxygenase